MDNEDNFFSPQVIAAMIICGLTFVGWQMYMQKKYPDAMAGKKAAQQVAAPATPVAQSEKSIPAAAPTADSAKNAAVPANQPEKLIAFASENLNFEISSRGMGLKNLRVNNFKDRKAETIELGHPEQGLATLETRLLGREEPLNFNLEKINDRMIVGRTALGKLQITKSMEIDPEKYLINYKIQVTGEDSGFIGLTTYLTEEVNHEQDGHNFLMPQFEKQEFYLETADTTDRVVFAKEDVQKSWSRVKVASMGSQYFTQAILDKSAVMPEAKGKTEQVKRYADLALQYSVLNKGEAFNLEYSAFIGPKSHHLLSSVDEHLAKVVDFGFFNWIGRHILMLLKWLYTLTANWGVSIILLTLMVRLCVLPINIYSYKSMKAMQAIQPQIKALKEKYKDDQTKQQQEMMALMKEAKVNPLGGCLPLFLQFPIFIALYQVLGNSIELYQAPFALWIHDLSLKDPFYILPVLMGVTMFIQQKITPNTMDPAQAKVMLFMPILFTFFMISLPSGLTLYMWVGALFSVLQQMYFMRDPKTPA